MVQPHRQSARLGASVPGITAPWTVRGAPIAPPQPVLHKRRAEISWLDTAGDVQSAGRSIPLVPLFLDACSAVARGTLVNTENGPVAVEDLLPGDRVETITGGLQTVAWIGSVGMMPDGQRRGDRLFRIPAEALGLARPLPDLLLGAAAHLMQRAPGLEALTGGDTALVPVEAMADGVTVIQVTPASPVQMYHLAFAAHHVFRANGVEIESFHPGNDLSIRLPRDMVALYLDLFPHLAGKGFGPVRMPRIAVSDLEGLSAA